MISKEKKEITAKATTKAIINGYIAYGILIGFIVYVLGLGVNSILKTLPNINGQGLSITISLIGAILLYFVLHGVCKLSIYDVFKKCKTNPENTSKVISRLNLFVILCVVFFAIASISILLINFNNQQQAIELATYKYSAIHSKEFVSKLENEMIIEFNETKANMVIATIILELGIVVSCFSIIPLQKKLIEKYNK